MAGRRLDWMYALGAAGLPETIEADGTAWRLERTVKHDFWAATGFYVAPDGARAVAKVNRRVGALGLPLRWTGRRLRHREVRAYARLADVPNVPALLGDRGTVAALGDTGFLHAYVAGEPLRKGLTVPDAFFDELRSLVDALAARGLAYVDTNKPENVLLGDDGRPHLIDFQISFDADAWWPKWFGRLLLKTFHRGDVYHVLKQKRRFRPDQLTEAERRLVERRGVAIRVHRTLTKPYFAVRRPVMRWLRRSGRVGEAGSE